MSDNVSSALAGIVAKYATPDPSTLAKLPKPTKKDNPKGKCGECGGWHGLPAVHLSYMGHADVTKALIDVDPLWTWEPAEMNAGAPVIVVKGNRLVMWGYLCVLGVRRLCVGTCEADKPDPEKELIGDLLRNGAMRFGIGINLWSKSDSSDPAGSGVSGGYDTPRTGKPTVRTKPGNATAAQIGKLAGCFREWGVSDREEKLKHLSRITKRTITSSTELTPAECSNAIDTIELAIRMDTEKQT